VLIHDIVSFLQVLIVKNPVLLMKGHEVGHRIGNPTPMSQSHQPTSASENVPQNAIKRPAAAPAAANGASAAKRPVSVPVVPIEAVNQFQRGLSVKGRVTSKTGMKEWTNERGSGCLFSFDIQDDTSEIRVTAFKEQAKKLFEQVQIGQVYVISKPQVKPANKRFSTLPHEFEMTVADDTVVTDGDENDAGCPQVNYNFVELRKIADSEPNSFVDVVAVVHRINDMVTIIQKNTQKELKKRDIILVDETAEITLTVWGQDAENFPGQAGETVIIKKAKVSDFSGRSRM
jgi:replication factor A1